MSEELQQKLRSQLWTVANTLRGNMSASDFMYFTLGFIFYKYLSEKIELYANEILEEDHITFKEVWNGKDEELKQDVKEECIQNLGYFIEPEYLYSTIIELISKKENILPSLERSLKKIEDSTIGQDSEDDFGGLFSDLDLASPKLGKTADDKNKLISNVLIALNGIDFGLQEAGDIDILGDAYEYYGAYNEAVFSMVGENGRKALRTKWFRHVRENGLNISKRFFSLHGLTSALRLRGFSADLRAIALHRACRWG